VEESVEKRIARLYAEAEELERRYADAEGSRSGRSAATAKRGPISLIAVLLGVALAVGVVAAIDLRRLNTPTGTALAWTSAAVFGECTRYLDLSRPADTAEDNPDEQCRALQQRTEPARESAGEVEIEVTAVEQDGDEAVATLRLARPERRTVTVPLPLRRSGDGWVVLRDEQVCAEIGCA
jgi:hypothetical protein